MADSAYATPVCRRNLALRRHMSHIKMDPLCYTGSVLLYGQGNCRSKLSSKRLSPMDQSPRRAHNPNDESSPSNCPKCRGMRIWAEVVAEGAWGHYSQGGVARTRGHSFVLGSDKLHSSCRALVCSS